jgi:hypothetical protein
VPPRTVVAVRCAAGSRSLGGSSSGFRYEEVGPRGARVESYAGDSLSRGTWICAAYQLMFSCKVEM